MTHLMRTIALTGTAVAGLLVGYAVAGLDDPAVVMIVVTTTPAPAPTATAVRATPTAAPTEVAIIRVLPDCAEPDTPSGSLCLYGAVAYPVCVGVKSREPCYKP